MNTAVRGATPSLRPHPVQYTSNSTAEENITETSASLRMGQKMPDFELPDQEWLPYGLFENLQRGPVVLVFYRGDW